MNEKELRSVLLNLNRSFNGKPNSTKEQLAMCINHLATIKTRTEKVSVAIELLGPNANRFISAMNLCYDFETVLKK